MDKTLKREVTLYYKLEYPLADIKKEDPNYESYCEEQLERAEFNPLIYLNLGRAIIIMIRDALIDFSKFNNTFPLKYVDFTDIESGNVDTTKYKKQWEEDINSLAKLFDDGLYDKQKLERACKLSADYIPLLWT